MNNLYFKICTPLLINLIVFNHSYADSACYIKMRGLNLSVTTETKKVCEPKNIKPETNTINTHTNHQKLEKSIIEMENYFVYPYTENKEKEKETAADGIGVGVSVGF